LAEDGALRISDLNQGIREHRWIDYSTFWRSFDTIVDVFRDEKRRESIDKNSGDANQTN
jgi:hypothetical protein